MKKEKSIQVYDKKIETLKKNLMELEDGCTLNALELLRKRFRQGCELDVALGSEKAKYGDAVIKELARSRQQGGIGIGKTYLYQLYAVAKHFNFSAHSFERDIAKRLKESGKISITKYINELASPKRNPAVVGGPDNHKELLIRKIEEGAKAAEEARETYGEDAEVEGAITVLRENVMDAREYLEATEFFGDPSKMAKGVLLTDEFTRLEFYCEWLRTQPCCVTGASPVEVHHLFQKGRSGNQSFDLFALPLISDLHREYHKIGFHRFEEKYKIDLRLEVIKHIIRFMRHLHSLQKF